MTQETKKKCTFWGVFILVATLILASAYFLPGVFASEEEENISRPESFLQDETNPSESSKILGTVSGEGNFFEIKDSTYLNITLESTAKIKARVESIPEMITINLEKLNQEDEITQLTIKNLVPNTTYHLYTDDYHNYTPLLSDEEGKAIFEVELSAPHILFIQTKKSTKFIQDNATGGDCYLIGNWDNSTKTCTLTQNVSETIQIDSDNITLDGNGHAINGSDTGSGVYVYNKNGVKIKNLTINRFPTGIYLSSPFNQGEISNNIINLSSSSASGIYAYNNTASNSSNNKIINNKIYSCSNCISTTGVSFLYNYSSVINNEIRNNEINAYYGINLMRSSQNKISGNLIFSNVLNNNSGTGISLDYGSSWNTLEDNTVIGFFSGIYFGKGDQLNNKSNTIRKNIIKLNKYGIYILVATQNEFSNNDFLNNTTTHAYNVYSNDNNFNSNYWDNWTSPDNNNDGVVDFPYDFNRIKDNLPSVCPFKSDFYSPTTNIFLSGEKGINDWYKSDVNVELNAVDDTGKCKVSSGIDKIEYSFDKENWITYTAPFVVSSVGETKLYYRAIDKAGNKEVSQPEEEFVIFSDNFNKPNGPAPDWTVLNGTWAIENGEYSGSGTSNAHSLTNSEWKDYKATIRVYPISSVGYWRAGIKIRSNAQNLDGYQIHSYNGGLRITKEQGGQLRYDKWISFSIRANAWHTLGVEARGNVIKFYYNGQLQDVLIDPSPISSGRILLASWADSYPNHTHFDDLVVTSWREFPKSTTIKIDKTNPEISANFNGTIGANDWYVSDVTATLSATDNIAIDKIEYSLDGENWQEYSNPVVLDYAGTKTFYYRTSDLAGNVAEGSRVIKIDKNPPETSISLEGTEGDNGWYKSDVLVTLLAQDNEGGLGEKPTEYSFDGENWQEYSGPFTISEEGEFTLYYRSKDLAGNVENTKQATIKIDKTAPTILATRTPANENGWNNSDVEVSFTCTDNLSGVESCSPDVIVSGEGENQSVTGTATDVAGNISMIFVENINIDKTSPVINGSRTPEANLYGWNREDVVVHFECSDNLSGVDFLTQDQTITTEGENQSREGICVDKAGNSVSTIVSGINIDKTAPETTDDYLYDGIWTNADATILLTAFDQEGLSGIEKTKYCIDSDGTCNPLEGEDYTEPIKIEDEGVFYLRYQSQDRAGNLEEVKQAVVMIDKTAPVASIEVKDARDDQCSFFFQLWIDNGQVSYDVVHGCSEVAASIDASIAGLKDYKLILKNSNGDIVKEVENNSLFFNFESGESVYTIVLEAYDNAGNFVTTSRTIYEDDDNDVATLEANGGAPDLFDLCPAQIPSEDLNKDGCQDVEGVNVNSLNWCIDTYTGRAETSLYPTTSLTQIGDSFVKHHRTWYQMQSKINSGVETGYAMNILDMQGRNRDEIHCSIDANNLKLSSGEELVYTKKDNAKLVYKEIFGRMIVKEKYHAHELSDGAKIFATMKYDEKRGESDLHLVFSNPEKTVSCIKEADRERDRCQENCGRRDLRCHKECNEQAVRAKIKCVQDNNYQLKQEYEGYRTLSLFDILKLIGYEE